MKLEKLAGATSEIWQIFIQDKTSTTGAGLPGLVFNTATLTAYYHRDTDTTATAIVLVTMTVGTFTSSGFKEIDATNMPGWYQFCPPNAALAAGAKSCGIHLKGGGNMADLPIEVQLVAYNPDDAVHLGLSSLPNAAAGASNGLIINGSNAGTVTLAALTVTATFTISDGLVVNRSTGGASALVLTGNGTGAGLLATGGANGVGISAISGGGGNPGFSCLGGGAGTGAVGFLATGAGQGAGISAVGAGHGILAAGGTNGATNDGLKAVAGTSGVDIRGNLTGNITGTLSTVTTLTTLPAITANWLTAAGINAGALNGKGDWLLSASYTAPLNLSAAATAIAVWTDTTAGDFTVAASVGKSIMNGVALGTGLTINGYTGNTPQTGDAYLRLGAPAGASTAADIAAVKTDTAAVKTTTDKFVFTVPNQVDSNVITKTGFSLAATGFDLIVMSDLAGPPVATATVKAGLSWIFMAVQNDRKTTATADTIANSAGAVVGTAVVSDDTVTYEKTKYT